MARLQFKPSLDIPLQVPNFKPYTVSYPLRYRGSTFMRFPFLYELADWVGVEDTVELYRVLPILEKMREKQLQVVGRQVLPPSEEAREKQLQVVGRQVQKNADVALHGVDGDVTTEDSTSLSAVFRQTTAENTHSLAASSHNIEILHGRALTTSGKSIQVGGDLQLESFSTLVEQFHRLESLFSTSATVDLYHLFSSLSKTRHESNTASEGFSLHSSRILDEVAEQFRLFSPSANMMIGGDLQLFGELRQLTEHSFSAGLKRIIDGLEDSPQPSFLLPQRLPEVAIESTQRLKVEEVRFANIINSATSATPAAKQIAQEYNLFSSTKDFKHSSTREHIFAAVRTISTPFIVDTILTAQKDYKMIETVENLTHTTKHFHHSQIEQNSLTGLSRGVGNLLIQKPQDMLVRAGQNMRTDTSSFFLSRAGAVTDIVQATTTLTNASHLSTVHKEYAPLRFAGANTTISTGLKWLSTIAAGVEVDKQRTLTKDKKVGQIAERVFVKGATKQIKVLDFWRLVSAGGGTASLGEVTLLQKDSKNTTDSAETTSLTNTTKISDIVEDIAQMAASIPKVADVISTIHHSTLYSRLWFIRDASGPYDPIILPSDYDYPVRLDTLQTPVEGHAKVEFQLRLKNYDTSLWFKVYDINYNLLSFIIVPNSTGREWDYYNTTEQDVRLTINTVSDVTSIQAILYNPSVAYIVLHHPEDSRGYRSWYAATQQILAQSHPIPIGNDLGLRELPVPIEIMIETINILLLMWGKFYMAFTGQTSQQALSGLCATFYEWITLQTSAEKAGDNIKYYYRMWRWLRWEAEQMLERSKGDPTLSGNYWVEQLMAEMVEYMEQHHFDHMPLFKDLAQMDEHRDIFDSPEGDIAFVLDKYKGLRNRRI